MKEPPEDIVKRLQQTQNVSKEYWTTFCRELTYAVIGDVKTLDEEIKKVLQNWRIERLSRIDLIILRLALCEMRDFEDIPLRVTLNEYIELAKQFGTDESFQFVNGILDKLAQAFKQKDFDQKSDPPKP